MLTFLFIRFYHFISVKPSIDEETSDHQRLLDRKNVMGRVKAMGGLKVSNLAFGGNKMSVTRKDQQAVEVWQGSTRKF
ncbi:hypothetical protein ES319_D11G126000v1 [Gossypium barbadense]|uniref:Uncharacterized protein n=2 Tax=Gossypium TaxID=3633 RepID=A0A5J5PAZ7_GOSBA|nr:hypothetical protein ES319_D11G126000v1 [Gossypium barbadense]TYG44913.1 hypothetical protein ES288_D11G132900v1 [Gossypium darwinii]